MKNHMFIVMVERLASSAVAAGMVPPRLCAVPAWFRHGSGAIPAAMALGAKRSTITINIWFFIGAPRGCQGRPRDDLFLA